MATTVTMPIEDYNDLIGIKEAHDKAVTTGKVFYTTSGRHSKLLFITEDEYIKELTREIEVLREEIRTINRNQP